MSRVLYVEASPRGEHSFSSRVARRFLESYCAHNPADEIETLNLFECELPEFGAVAAAQKMAQIADLIGGGKGIAADGPWHGVHREIARLKAADKVLLSAPMWNYSIPYRLKHYIDVICQPGLTFYVNRQGHYVGMLKGKPLQLVLASGSAYHTGFPGPDDGTKTDFQRAYLEHVTRFIGFTDIRVLKIEPTADARPEDIQTTLQRCLDEAVEAAAVF